MDSINRQIETSSDLDFLNDILHDAVFSLEDIKVDLENNEFQLTCFRFLNEVYEIKQMLPFVHLEKRARKKCMLRFFDLDKIEKKINANIKWYSIFNISYKAPQITINTEGCIDLSLFSSSLSGSIEDCEEIIRDSLGYTDISFGKKTKD